MSWYDEMPRRLADGEDPLDLTIEKFELFLDDKIKLELGFLKCPLCISCDVTMSIQYGCSECPVGKTDQYCTRPTAAYGDEIYEVMTMLQDDEMFIELDSYVEETVLPFLRSLKEESND